MANKNYQEYDVVKALTKKQDIRIQGKQIQELSGKGARGDVGIKSRGKIDFLCIHRGFVHMFVPEFSN